jgi:hypothetical protein
MVSKDALRQQMPTVAAIVDELRPFLGRVIYARENGHVIDRREPETNVFDIPPGYRKPCEPKKGGR